MRNISKSELARLVNVSPAAITKACNNQLKEAFDGKRIDLDHEVTKNYIKKKSEQNERKNAYTQKVKKVKNDFNEEPEVYEFVKVDKKENSTGQRAAKENKKNVSLDITDNGTPIPQSLKKYLKYTIEEAINEFGTDYALVDFLRARKLIEDIEEKNLKNKERKKELVSVRLVKLGIFDPINTGFNQLLEDGSKSISNQVYNMVKSGSTKIEVRSFINEQISSYIKPVKNEMKKTLESLLK